METSVTTRRAELGRHLAAGAVGGIVAAVAMAMFAMIAAATYQGTGFFTPMYHIASLLLGPQHMMTSVENATAGDPFYFTLGPAVTGMSIHLVTGAIYGAIFGLLVHLLRLNRPWTVIAGLIYGFAVLLFSSFVALPLAAAIFNAGRPISHMPEMAGWGTFTVEHAIYGVVLGAVAAWVVPAARGAVAGGDVAFGGARA